MNWNHESLLEDSGEDQSHHQINETKSLLEKFDNVDVVLENAALSAALLNHLFIKSHEYNSLLFYYTFQKYKRVNETKNCMRNHGHINMEIYTIFLHPKSILLIPFDNSEVIKKIEENIASEECLIHFGKVCENIVLNILNLYVEQYKEELQLGLESFAYVNKINEVLDRQEELRVLENLHSHIINCLIRSQKTRCLPSQQQDMKNLQILNDFRVSAITLALHTQFEHFLLDRKYSDGIRMIPSNLLPTNTLLSPIHVKLCNKQRIKGHCFDDCTLSKVSCCFVCKIILWGSDPSCLFCRNCKISIHKVCRDAAKDCKQSSIELLTEIGNGDLIKQNGGNLTLPESSIACQSENENIKSHEKQKVQRKPSLSKFLDWRTQSSSTSNNEKTRKISVKWTKSMTANTDHLLGECVTRSRSAGASLSDSLTSPIKKRSNADHSSEHLGECFPNVEDMEMNVLETFEPEIELQIFSNAKSDKGGYQRLLVLLEFHHKTRFIRMNLKRFKNFLVDPWIKLGEHMELFDSLSLNSIEKLYTLIGSLVDVIDSCKAVDSYDSSVAQKILHWISDDDDKNLKQWLHLSTDLCCTNILSVTKTSLTEHRQMSPKLNDLFSVEINRLVLIEQLSNMRSLLFNLPMIVTKIVKDLRRHKKFHDEATLWEQVGHKLTRLPQLIDERCMPVVHIINNGTIVNSIIKYNQHKMGKEYNKRTEMYINNFPKTIFKNQFIDFQFVKISNLRQYSHGESKLMQSSVYVRDEIDAAIICYEKEMVILQKENEKYLIKQFKSPGANKLFPIIIFEQVHATKHTVKENTQFQHDLTLLLIDKAVLAQILFKEEKSRDMWFDIITKTTTNMDKEVIIKQEHLFVPTSTVSSNTFDHSEENLLAENEDSNVDCSNFKNIRSSFNTSVNHFISSINLISNELTRNEVHENDVKKINDSGPDTTKEFMLGYMNILKEFMMLGGQMLNQVKSLDSGMFLQRDVALMNLSKLRDITSIMKAFIQSNQHIRFGNETSEISSIRNEDTGFDNRHLHDIKCYVEEIITDAECGFNSMVS